MKVRVGVAAIGAAMMASSALAGMGGSTIYGVDFRSNRFYTTTTDNFVGNFTSLGTSTPNAYGIDFDATATTLWGARTLDSGLTYQYGSFDLSNGVYNQAGLITGLGTGEGITGLTAAANGSTWYLSTYIAGTGSKLYVGDITTGAFSLVGVMNANIMIDIAIDSQGNLYGTNITDDLLYSINTTTGAGTAVGPLGFNMNFAQGMDFDWSTDTLYATMYQGTGVGQFASINTTTGAATMLADTLPLNAEMEMAIKVAAVPAPGAIALLGLAGLAARRRRRA